MFRLGVFWFRMIGLTGRDRHVSIRSSTFTCGDPDWNGVVYEGVVN